MEELPHAVLLHNIRGRVMISQCQGQAYDRYYACTRLRSHLHKLFLPNLSLEMTLVYHWPSPKSNWYEELPDSLLLTDQCLM